MPRRLLKVYAKEDRLNYGCEVLPPVTFNTCTAGHNVLGEMIFRHDVGQFLIPFGGRIEIYAIND